MDFGEVKSVKLIVNHEGSEFEKKEMLLIYERALRKEEDYKRRHQRHQLYFFTDYDFSKIFNQFKIFINHIEDEIFNKERNSELYKAMNRLTINERNVIILYYFYDKTTVAIAERLGITQQAISKTKKRALNKMSNDLKLRELYLNES
ncbi:MAG: sigma-70 family RNA polymerase sigma factor [Erysipelotrichaceae bacterium]|uniref:sigma-70 family RNA polymerase sigma factor n=1 Tax=Anaerorhabdus sp. TaxID=1872524 RepID=UPI002FCB466A